MEDTQVYQVPVPDDMSVFEPQEVIAPQSDACESCGSITALFDVPHHQVGNTKVWRYCQRCKMAHDVEVATNDKLKEIMAVNPSAVNDPMFVGQVRDQLTQELMQG